MRERRGEMAHVGIGMFLLWLLLMAIGLVLVGCEQAGSVASVYCITP